MPFSGGSYDTETLTLMTRSLDAAWSEVARAASNDPAVDCTGFRIIMALSIMTAIKDGERDPKQLRLLALGAVEDLY